MERCQCGGLFEPSNIAPHAYLGATSGCWKAYTDFLTWEYTNYSNSPVVADLHRLAVDAYAAQHGVNNDIRNVRSVRIHLVSLYLHLRCGKSLDFAHAQKARLSQVKKNWDWLEPPDFSSSVNIGDFTFDGDIQQYQQFVGRWAESVLNAWLEKHGDVIIALAESTLIP